MARGGIRPGSGRKPVVSDISTRDVRNLIRDADLIAKLQRIVFEGEGNPDTKEIIAAIKILLDKKVPNLQAVQLSTDPDSPLGVIMYPAKKQPGE